MAWLEGTRPTDLGVRDGRLKPPPATPNAVSSQATTPYHAVEPLRYVGPAHRAAEALVEIIQGFPRTTLVVRTDDYVRAEFKSAVLGFVDDVEFYLPPGQKVIHVRSASRLGHSDFGVNRKRVETIRAALAKRGI
ncbi:MAG: DUF1499 domain-containing protein [Burkholderiales bacterium]